MFPNTFQYQSGQLIIFDIAHHLKEYEAIEFLFCKIGFLWVKIHDLHNSANLKLCTMKSFL